MLSLYAHKLDMQKMFQIEKKKKYFWTYSEFVNDFKIHIKFSRFIY